MSFQDNNIVTWEKVLDKDLIIGDGSAGLFQGGINFSIKMFKRNRQKGSNYIFQA